MKWPNTFQIDYQVYAAHGEPPTNRLTVVLPRNAIFGKLIFPFFSRRALNCGQNPCGLNWLTNSFDPHCLRQAGQLKLQGSQQNLSWRVFQKPS